MRGKRTQYLKEYEQLQKGLLISSDFKTSHAADRRQLIRKIPRSLMLE